MKIFILSILTVLAITSYDVIAQNRLFTRSGKIIFFSKAPLEDIKAINNQVSCIYDIESNRIIASVLINAFEFEKALMQKHFNENYLETEKFPKATFKGKILDHDQIDFKSNWIKNVEFEGDLTIHGVTKNIKNQAHLTMKNGTLNVSSVFYVLLKDYEIKIPSTVINNVSEKVKVEVNFIMNVLKN
ncbi:MAG: YceI family protein [Bacteroidales bacterium]|nr:YceI family protein [Bacteroidales bacterium]